MFNSLKTTPDIIRATRFVVILTFFLGTGLMVWYYYNPCGEVIYLSLFYIISMLFLNSYFGIRLLQLMFTEPEFRQAVAGAIVLLLTNIPVGYFYIQLGLHIYQTSSPV
ncbi:hypothetical protein [Flavobacterium sp.]|jgi:hypothetical protein|uniref:hypothetical protein n=1 Tax=Flavobacterium sp. TaxID=239 RepID=UPI002612C94B|nr:hypothetical protein [Flavobacterium sp.]